MQDEELPFFDVGQLLAFWHLEWFGGGHLAGGMAGHVGKEGTVALRFRQKRFTSKLCG